MAVDVIPIGDIVLCDFCNTDFTNSSQSGGLLFGSNGIGPCCAEGTEADARRYGEERHIKARCPSNKSFADWIRQDIRGGKPAVIEILTGDDFWR